jgi:hypothetical protein
MKCVSIRQPWASAILAGLLDVEYRCYPTEHRGDLLIHASSETTDWDRQQFVLFDRRGLRWDELAFGKVIGVVELWTCGHGHNGEWAWCLRNPRRVEPFAIEPGRRLFDVENRPVEVLAPARRTIGKVRQPAVR